MSTAIREYIVRNIVTAIERISIDNGYDVDIKKVYRIPTSAFSSMVYPYAVVIDTGETLEEGKPVNYTTCFLKIQVVFYNQQWNNIRELSIQYISAIEFALHTDPTLGGYVVDLDVINNETFGTTETAPYGGGSVTFMVQYRHLIGNPYAQ